MPIRKSDFAKIRIETLLVFQELVRSKSFSKTAKIFGKSQGTISQQLKELEKALGKVTLIKRTSQSFELTPSGRNLDEILSEIVPNLEQIYSKIVAEATKDQYEIELISSSIPGEFFLPKKMMDFQKKYPKTNFSVKIKNTTGSIQSLIEQKVNFCAVGGFAGYDSSLFEKKIIGTDAIIIFARKEHPIHKEKDKIDRMADYPWIFREKGSATRNLFLKHYPNSLQLTIALEFWDNNAIISAIKASDALSALSFNIISNYKEQDLKEIKIHPHTPISRNLYLLKLKNTQLKSYEQSFWDYC